MFITTLEFGKLTDVYLEFKYLGPDLSNDDIYFIIEFSTIPFTIENILESVQHDCNISHNGTLTNYT
jgi:hypothetical protein